MGCDIHAYVEYDRFGMNPLWWTFAELHIERDYTLFGYMAGVRNKSVEPVAMPRGLPNDISITTKSEYQEWEGDAHHMSWLSFDELKSVYAQRNTPDLKAVIEMMRILDHEGWTPRLVFWFDN